MTKTSPLATPHPLATLLAGHGGVAVLTLLRNVIAARLIGLEQFGIAASFAIVLSAVEMGTNLGVQQMIVRDGRGDNARFQRSLHFIQLLRGLLGVVIVYLLAGPMAGLLGAPDTKYAFQILALVPLMNGLLHLDCWRYQRMLRFGPSIIAQLGPALLALLLVVPLVTKFGDYRALLVAALAQAAGLLIMSHLLSEHRYLVAFNRRHMRDVLRFGAPLALNGMLLLAVFHGEKLIVGHLRGAEALALVAMGFTLTLTPALVIAKSVQSYSLPLLSKAFGTDAFADQAARILILCIWVGGALAVLLASLSMGVPLLLGPEFAPLVGLIPILAALHGLRVAKTGISITALAMGNTFNTVLGNAPRILALPLVYSALHQGASLADILWIAVAAEAAGLCAAFAGLWVGLRKAQVASDPRFQGSALTTEAGPGRSL